VRHFVGLWGTFDYPERLHYHNWDVSISDRDLIRACRKGDNRAWRSLVERYRRLVFSIPLNYGLSTEDAEDLTQLTFTFLIQSLDSLDDDSRLGPWLATVAHRHTWRVLKRNRREGTGVERDVTEYVTLLGKGDESIERWELLAWLDQGLSLISEPCRRLLQALYFDPQQPTYEEVAARLNMPVGSIGPTRARCLQYLKRALTEEQR
jgi:RNA polymerase sigma factor (sigma-70 family)